VQAPAWNRHELNRKNSVDVLLPLNEDVPASVTPMLQQGIRFHTAHLAVDLLRFDRVSESAQAVRKICFECRPDVVWIEYLALADQWSLMPLRYPTLIWLIVSEEFSLTRGNAFPIQFSEPSLPLLNQFQHLPTTPLGAGEHSFVDLTCES
jgi:hypothetical protein